MHKDNRFLLLCDLDGTLLDSNGRVSEKNISAICEFEKKGGLFAIATGRTQQTALMHIQDLPVNCPCILYNGAAVYDYSNESFLFTEHIEKDLVWEVIKDIIPYHRNVCIQVFGKDSIDVISGGEVLDPLMLSEGQKFSICHPDDVKTDILKILINGQLEDLLNIEKQLVQFIKPGMANIMLTAARYLELLPPGVTKGSAMLHLVKRMGIPQERTVAIGDYYNDIDMIKLAGIGAAPCNAHYAALDAADIIVSSNDEHALADLLSKIPYA